ADDDAGAIDGIDGEGHVPASAVEDGRPGAGLAALGGHFQGLGGAGQGGAALDGVDDGRVVRVDGDLAAVVALDHGPVQVVVELDGAVEARAAEEGVGVGRARGDAVELADRQVAVEVGPGLGGGIVAPDAVVAAGQDAPLAVGDEDVLAVAGAGAVGRGNVGRRGRAEAVGGDVDLAAVAGAGLVAADVEVGRAQAEQHRVVVALAALVVG